MTQLKRKYTKEQLQRLHPDELADRIGEICKETMGLPHEEKAELLSEMWDICKVQRARCLVIPA